MHECSCDVSGTHRQDIGVQKPPMHIINAQICERGIALASETVEAKSNESPAVQELVKKMARVKNKITIDNGG